MSSSQYTLNSPTSITIKDTLNTGDYLVFIFETAAPNTGAGAGTGTTGPIGPQGVQGNSSGSERHETSWTGGSQTFTLPKPFYSFTNLIVTGISLSSSQYTLNSPTSITIKDTLNTGDYLVFIYETTSPNGSGEPGPKGEIGLTGPIGPTGNPGQAGVAGPAGAAGATGNPGQAGVAGPTGAAGNPGQAGVAGPTGPTGNPGAAGNPGQAGVAGPTGLTGNPGQAGVAGPTGPTGNPGQAGVAGPTGPTGPTGPSASNLDFIPYAGAVNNVDLGDKSITASAFYGPSDIRLKDIISKDGDTIWFKWKDKRDDLIHIGLVAQEVKNNYPDQVQVDKDGILSVNYIEVLVAEIQLLKNMVKKLQNGV